MRVTLLLTLFAIPLLGQEPPEELAKRAKDAIVIIRSADREGSLSGTGTGFVVRKDGVIASNFHVIGQNRDLSVEFADGTKLRPTHILAADRKLDLALIKVEPEDELPVLPLGDSDRTKAGQGIMTIGNPLGLEFSIGKGVIAAKRELDALPMLQVAIPLEPGSSGSPVLDLNTGKVLGVLGIKSGDAIGFAVPINQLKPLLKTPRPVPLETWLTIGALDPADWTTLFGGDWRQRAGRLHATGSGRGVGGRTLALATAKPPEDGFELTVEVKLSDESGAAGLVFCADGKDRHYGFYPTGGNLRLARFEGPTPFSWKIIETVSSDAYRPGEWNRLHLRYAPGSIECRVNGQVVIQSDDEGLAPGQIGLCKFREPTAEFRRFRVGQALGDDPKAQEAVDRKLTRLLTPESRSLAELAKLGPKGIEGIHRRARSLREEAEQLEVLAADVHRTAVVQALRQHVAQKEFDLVHAALLLARLDNPELETAPYLARVERMANAIKKGTNDIETLENVIEHLFTRLSFHGSTGDYYHRANSYLNEVLDDREGLPISLSVLFVEIARRKGLDAHGIAIPRHFIAGVNLGEKQQLIDPFHGGRKISRAEAAKLSGFLLDDAAFKAANPEDILVRMLVNLLGVTEPETETPRMIGYLDAILVLDPEAADRRGMRAMLNASQKRYTEALADLDTLLEQEPAGMDLRTIRSLRARIEGERDREP